MIDINWIVLNFINSFFLSGQIVCTQPRRLAARTLASRVAEEFGCEVTEEVNNFIKETLFEILI